MSHLSLKTDFDTIQNLSFIFITYYSLSESSDGTHIDRVTEWYFVHRVVMVPLKRVL